MFFDRVIDFSNTLKRKSFFLFGPRQTGKSTLLKSRFPEASFFDLLDPTEFLRFTSDPSSFGKEIEFLYTTKNQKIFIVDEIQKLPILLDEVHRQIELRKDLRFILTGSSARKLRKSGVNLLGGRASKFLLYPLVYPEIGSASYYSRLEHNLCFGFLPSIQESQDPWRDLSDYVGVYLREEIQQEAIVRSLHGFMKFLDTAALTSGEQINFTQVGNDAQVPSRTVREFYGVLEDTLVGDLLPAFTNTKKRKAMTSAKFYFFDQGITNVLLGRKSISAKTKEFGGLLEQRIYSELSAYISYKEKSEKLFYWRSTSQFEVDFVIQHSPKEFSVIEVKSSTHPGRNDYKGILALGEELNLVNKFVVCMCDRPYVEKEGITVLPLIYFLEKLWKGDFF